MCVQHQASIDKKFSLEVAARVPFAWTDTAITNGTIEMQMRVVSFPWFVESIVYVFEELL
jgi:hypothetical protein